MQFRLKSCFDTKCSCSISNENTVHFFLHCHYYPNIKKLLLNEISSIDQSIIHLSDYKLVEVLLNRKPSLNGN